MSDASVRVLADFNGLFGDVLCLAHSDTVRAENGEPVALRAGMTLTAFDVDQDAAGEPDEILARGVVAAAPDWLACRGSRWVLRIDGRGIRYRNAERDAAGGPG